MGKLVIILLTIAFTLCGCSGSQSYGGADNTGISNVQSNTTSKDMDSISEVMEGASGDINSEYAEDTSGSDGGEDSNKTDTNTSNKRAEKLVYSGNVQIDTLEYNKSLKKLRGLIDKYKGFIENESYSDNASTYGTYYIEADVKQKQYTGTIRIPSKKYDEFMSGMDSIGDIREQSSNVDNITQAYNTNKAQLDIYEAKRDRYLKLLEKAEDDEYALQIEHELTELEVKISDITTMLNVMDTDVDYSTINITLRAVKKYEEKSRVEDSYLERLRKAIIDSAETFVESIGNFIIWLVYAVPRIIIFILVIIILLKIKKKKGISLSIKNKKQQDNNNIADNKDEGK